MSFTIKRALLIVLLLAVAALIGVGLYLAYKSAQVGPTTGNTIGTTGGGGQLPPSNTRTTTTQTGNEPPTTGELPTGQNIYVPQETAYKPDTVTKISTDYALFPSVGVDGNLRYHNGADGKFYKLNPDGTTKKLSDQVFYNVNKVTWADTKNSAVLEYPDGSKIIYNFDTQKQVSLPRHWQEFSFSPDGAQVAAKSIGLSPENRWLVTINDDGSGTRLIEPLGENADKVIVDWSPSRQTVALSQTGEPLGLDRREVLFVGLNGENLKSTVVEGLDFKPAWSPTGKQLLYSIDSARSNFKPELWIVNSYGDDIGSSRRSIGLNTWADKCTFVGDTTLYCAVPRSLPDGSGMAPEIAANIADDLYKIDLKTGLKTSIPLDGDYRVTNLSYNTETNSLFFTDSFQNGVYKVAP